MGSCFYRKNRHIDLLDRYALRSRDQICGFKVGGIHRLLGTGSDLSPDLSIVLITMEVEVALGVMFFPAFDNQLGFIFPFLPTHGLPIAPLLANTDILPHGHAPVHGRILSALETYPGILGKYWVNDRNRLKPKLLVPGGG